MAFVTRYANFPITLVHGEVKSLVNPSFGPEKHAWAEIAGVETSEGIRDVVFDGVARRFYDRDSYYATMDAKVSRTYSPFEALALAFGSVEVGPGASGAS